MNDSEKEALWSALRGARHEEAPIPLLRSADRTHVLHMVEPVIEQIKVDAYERGRFDARKDELVTCPECGSTFETEDGTTHEGRADLAAKVEALADELDRQAEGVEQDGTPETEAERFTLRADASAIRAILPAAASPATAPCSCDVPKPNVPGRAHARWCLAYRAADSTPREDEPWCEVCRAFHPPANCVPTD